MASEPIRDQLKDHLLTPKNAAFIVIDYQPIQVSSIRSMQKEELVFNVVECCKAAKLYDLPIIHSSVNVATGKNKPPIQPVMEILAGHPTYDRTTINSWEDAEFKQAVVQAGRQKLIMAALWTEACLTFPALDALEEGYKVYAVADAVGGTSVGAHEAAAAPASGAPWPGFPGREGASFMRPTSLWQKHHSDGRQGQARGEEGVKP